MMAPTTGRDEAQLGQAQRARMCHGNCARARAVGRRKLVQRRVLGGIERERGRGTTLRGSLNTGAPYRVDAIRDQPARKRYQLGSNGRSTAAAADA
jgi:hypothetical protein